MQFTEQLITSLPFWELSSPIFLSIMRFEENYLAQNTFVLSKLGNFLYLDSIC